MIVVDLAALLIDRNHLINYIEVSFLGFSIRISNLSFGYCTIMYTHFSKGSTGVILYITPIQVKLKRRKVTATPWFFVF